MQDVERSEDIIVKKEKIEIFEIMIHDIARFLLVNSTKFRTDAPGGYNDQDQQRFTPFIVS